MTKILNTTTLTFLQETTFIFYTIAFGWINPRNIISNIIMIFNINSTRGQTRFLACVARVTCLVLVKCIKREFNACEPRGRKNP